MNIEALQKTRDALAAAPDEDYGQEIWASPCGSPRCIAGYAVTAYGYRIGRRQVEADPDDRADVDGYTSQCWHPDHPDDVTGVSVRAAKLLDIDRAQAMYLFGATPYGDEFQPGIPPTRSEALELLDYAIEEQVLAWPPRR